MSRSTADGRFMPKRETLVITGASGRIGRHLREHMARPERTLRLLDIVAPDPPTPGEHVDIRVASLTDLDALIEACTGADAVVHLAGQSKEAPFDDVLTNNVAGTYHLLEAARLAGIARVVFASSLHATGFYRGTDAPADGLPADAPARPDTLYGWSKAAGEMLARLYADRFGMDIICLRIGAYSEAPGGDGALMRWLSPGDCVRLIEASLSVPTPGYRIVWGVSNYSHGWLSPTAADAIGYHPEDDAARYGTESGNPESSADRFVPLGEEWTTFPLGEPC